MIDLPPFDASLADTLRSEAHVMAAAYVDALLALAPAGTVLGVYGKGSAWKSWESVIDYVPELSDVDLHVRFADPEAAACTLGTVERALAVADRALAMFDERFPDAVHTPRPQLIRLDEIEQKSGYQPSPDSTVMTLFGEKYVGLTPWTHPDTRAVDRLHFLEDADFIEGDAPMKLVDRPGRFAWQVVSVLTWRIGPAGPRLLTQLGVDPHEAWSLNRTSIVRALASHANPRLAASYAEFYLAGRDGFRSGFRDGTAAVRAILAAASFFRDGRALIP